MRESFVFYTSFLEAIESFNSKKSKIKLYDAFLKYAINGEYPKNLKGAEQAVFILYKFIQDKYAILENKDIRTSPAYKKWRNEVLKRDNYQCQICGTSLEETTLHAHHIKMFAFNEEERFFLDNGITLCEKCHKGIHSRSKKICQN